MLLWMQTMIVDELKIEELTTRGKHKRVSRFKAKNRRKNNGVEEEEESFGSIGDDVDDDEPSSTDQQRQH